MPEIFYALPAKGKNIIVPALCLALHETEKIRIIASRKSSVAGYDYKQPPVAAGRLRVWRLEVAVRVRYVFQCLSEDGKIGLALIRPFLCLAQLRCCHQLHGLGDLHRILDTADPEFDGLHICSSHENSSLSLLCQAFAASFPFRKFCV